MSYNLYTNRTSELMSYDPNRMLSCELILVCTIMLAFVLFVVQLMQCQHINALARLVQELDTINESGRNAKNSSESKLRPQPTRRSKRLELVRKKFTKRTF